MLDNNEKEKSVDMGIKNNEYYVIIDGKPTPISYVQHGYINEDNAVKIPKNRFYKVSWEQFKKDAEKLILPYLNDHNLYTALDFDDNGELFKNTYDAITLPRRSTKRSAGYDFYMPFDKIPLYPGESIVIPTGIKMELTPSCYLALYPRSSYGFKYKMRLDNTVGIVDADYYNNKDNEGHIMIKLSCELEPPKFTVLNHAIPVLTLDRNDKFAQGIITLYGVTDDDEPCDSERTGGIGSTGK